MVFLTNPLWLIKTRMQLQPGAAAQLKQPMKQEAYRGLWHAVRTIVREEGPRGLYKGRGVCGMWGMENDRFLPSLSHIHAIIYSRAVSRHPPDLPRRAAICDIRVAEARRRAVSRASPELLGAGRPGQDCGGARDIPVPGKGTGCG
jgi:hypothetical protein